MKLIKRLRRSAPVRIIPDPRLNSSLWAKEISVMPPYTTVPCSSKLRRLQWPLTSLMACLPWQRFLDGAHVSQRCGSVSDLRVRGCEEEFIENPNVKVEVNATISSSQVSPREISIHLRPGNQVCQDKPLNWSTNALENTISTILGKNWYCDIIYCNMKKYREFHQMTWIALERMNHSRNIMQWFCWGEQLHRKYVFN